MAEVAKVFRIEMSGGKDVEKDIVSVKGQMTALGKEIAKTKKALDGLLSSKGDTTAVSNLKSKIAELETQLGSLNEQRQQAISTAQKESAATTQLADDTSKQVGEYLKLNQQYKEAKTNVQNLATEFGVESEQAIEAAKSAGLLQDKIRGINDLVKNGGVKVEVPIVPTVVDEPKTAAKQAVSDVDKAKSRLSESASDDAKEVAKLNAQTAENNRQNKAAALEALGLTDAYKKLEQQYGAAARAAKNIAAEQGEDSDAFKAAAADAKKLSDRLKEIDAAVGQNQRNVGNYTESFSILEKELVAVTQRLNTLKSTRDAAGGQGSGPRAGEQPNVRAASDDDILQLTKQQTALQQVVSNTSRGFTNLTQELKVNERSLQSLRAVGLQETDSFRSLQKQTNETRKSFNDFAKSQKILSSDLPALTGLTVAAKGLAGAYAIGAGTAAIFGDEEGKIEKEVQKLVAIMTVLNGLQEAHELLEQKDAIATAVAAAAQKAYAIVVGESTGALKVFRLALAATGLGAFILILGYVIANWKELTSETEKTNKAIDDLEGVTNNTKIALKGMGKSIDEIADASIKELTDEIEKLNTELGLTPTTVEKASASLQLLKNESDRIGKQRSFFDLGDKTILESLHDIGTFIGIAGDRLETNNSKLRIQQKLYDNLALKQQFLNRELLNTERSKAVTQTFKNAQDANSRILSLQATSLQDRLNLTAQNYELEKRVIERAHLDELKEAHDNEAKVFAADQKFNSSKIIAERNYQYEHAALIRQYAIRDEAAQTEINQRSLQSHIDANKAIIDNDTSNYQQRLTASKKILNEQLSLDAEQRRHDLTAEGLTQTEISNIKSKYRAADLKAHDEFVLRNQDIDKKEFERQNKELQHNLDERIALIKEGNEKTQNDPSVNNVDKAQAQLAADDAILEEEQNYYAALLKLNATYNKDALSQIKVGLANQRKIIEANRKLLYEGEIKDIIDANGILTDKFKQQLADATINVLKGNLSPRQQAAALIKLQQDAQDLILKAQVDSLKKELEALEASHKQKLISEKEYQDKLTEYKEAEAKYAAQTADKEKSSNEIIAKVFADFGDAFLEKVLKIKLYTDDLQGELQRANDAMMADLDQINNVVGKTVELFKVTQENQIEASKKTTLDFIDRQEQLVLAQAQSEEEKAAIQKKFDKKREDAEKLAAKRKKQLALKQAAMDFALGVVQTIAQYKLPILWGPIVALMTVGYLLQRAIISQQQFAKGGQVQPNNVGNGLIKTGPNIPTQKNGDNVLATVRTGEVILNKQQQQALGGARVFRHIGVPGFASGGTVGSTLTAPSFSGREFLNGSNNFNSDTAQQIAELKNLQAQVLEAVYSTDAKPVVLDPHKVTKAQQKRRKDVSVGSLKK